MVFDFDEDVFAAEYQARCAVEELGPREAADQVEDMAPSHALGTLSIPAPGTSYGSSPGNGPRRASVYRRMLVKLMASSPGQIAIPTNYDSDPMGHQRILADFEPLRVLGQGAYGKVYLVRDRHTGALYALKQLRKPAISVYESKPAHETKPAHENHVQRTLSERQILANITHHPNVVKIFFALQDRDKFYLLLEYLPGGELFHHLTLLANRLGNVFREDDVAFYAAQMALGLCHLHSLGIVYRDLKPENCLLNAAGHLVLTDFGLSKDIGPGAGERCRSIIGTPEYMAPEVLKGEDYGYAVDWWSLGCVIYDMMSGRPPFTGNLHHAIQEKIIKKKLVVPRYFSQDARDMVTKLLQKSQDKRFAVDARWLAFTGHRFFRKISWRELEAQTSPPPIVPIITDPALAENFSLEFTLMKLSTAGMAIPAPEAPALFEGFSYTASGSYIERFAVRDAV